MLRRGMMAQAASGGGAAAYRYWRIYVTANNGAAYLSMNEVELRLSAGGADQTAPGGATAASSSYFGDNGALAVNNNASDTSAWVASWWPAGIWWRYDFGAGNAKAITEVAIWPESTSGYTRAPKDFKVQGSDDGSSWTDVATFTNVTGWSSYGAGGGGIYRTFAL